MTTHRFFCFQLNMINWNQDGFKIGLCDVPPVGQKRALLCLSNNLCIKDVFVRLNENFNKLYRRQAHLHHYLEYMELGQIAQAEQSVQSIIEEYQQLENEGAYLGAAGNSGYDPQNLRYMPEF